MSHGTVELREDIRRHLANVGSKRWRPVWERHPAVSLATFWRAVREAKRGVAGGTIGSAIEGTVKVRPPSPLPELLPSTGPGLHRSIVRVDHMRAYRELFDDAAALRQSALKSDGSIKHPRVFDRAMRTRLKVLLSAARYEGQIYSLKNIQTFIEVLMEELAKESPSFQCRVIERVRKIAETGGGRQSPR